MAIRVPGEEPSPPAGRHRPSPKKLLESKWTAVAPVDRELHFVVTRIVSRRSRGGPIEAVELRAVYSGRSRVVAWRELCDAGCWHRGWR
jgi:tryptophan-rich hypothetical protein